MMTIGLAVSEALYQRLETLAADHGVKCQRFDADSENFDGVVVEFDRLSLRLIATCDARGVPFAVIGSGVNTEMLAGFGIESSLGPDAQWPGILEALGLVAEIPKRPETEDYFGGEASQSPGDDGRVTEPRVIAVWGPSGAPGRTTVAINVASEVALLGKRVLLIDADTYGGAVAGYLELFDEAPGFLAASRLAGQNSLDHREIARLTHQYDLKATSLSILSGIVSPRRWPEMSAPRVRACIDVLRSHFDVIVCDVGFNLEQDEEISSDLTAPRRNQATLEILSSADVTLAVAAADVIGIARFIQCLESLKSLTQQSEVVVAANRVRDSRSANAAVVKHTLHRFAGISDVTIFNHDVESFATAVDMAVPLCVAAPKSSVREQFAEVALRLVR